MNAIKNADYIGVEGLMREIKKGGVWNDMEEGVRSS